MDQAFDVSEYMPTRPGHSPILDTAIPEIATLFEALRTQTAIIRKRPYDPEVWVIRAETLSRLNYPELAYGDAWKAEHQCAELLQHLPASNKILGVNRGFWMYTTAEDQAFEQHSLVDVFTSISQRALRVQQANQNPASDSAGGVFTPRQYPWLAPEHRTRGHAVVGSINLELEHGLGESWCIARSGVGENQRYGNKTEAPSQTVDRIGMFAACNITKGTMIVEDQSNIWGASIPVKSSRAWDTATDELGELEGVTSMDYIRTTLKMRCLRKCKQDGIAHPLDLPMLARVKPTYHGNRKIEFKKHADIAAINLALIQYGVDIMADHNFDTWVLFVVEARLDNNCWSDPGRMALHSLFAMFNHSCEANCTWTTVADHRLQVFAAKDIRAGEQLFVSYNVFVEHLPVQERSRAMEKWIEGGCQCNRCEREWHTEQQSNSSMVAEDQKEVQPWNIGIATLPEDVERKPPSDLQCQAVSVS